MYQSLPPDQFNESLSIQCYDEVETFLSYGKKRLTHEEKQRIEAERYIENRVSGPNYSNAGNTWLPAI